MKHMLALLALLFLLSACSLLPAQGSALGGPTVTPTDCGCSAEGPHVTPTGGLGAPAGPGLPAPDSGEAPEALESYRDRWQAYTDAARGFSFEYPAAYSSERYGFCAAREAAVSDGALLRLSLGSRTELTVTETGAELDAAVEAFRADPARQDAQFDAPQQRVVAGQPAITLPYRSGGTNRYAESTFFIKDGLLYRVDAGGPSACDIAEMDLTEMGAYTRMLESFKFE